MARGMGIAWDRGSARLSCRIAQVEEL
jgi:hypothetical protein